MKVVWTKEKTEIARKTKKDNAVANMTIGMDIVLEAPLRKNRACRFGEPTSHIEKYCKC